MQTPDEKLRNLIAEQAAEWHVAHEDGGLDSKQTRAFMHWLRSSPLHVAEYLTVSGIARDAAEAARASEASLDQLMAEEERSVQSLQANGANGSREFGVVSPRAHHAVTGRERRSHRIQRRLRFRIAAAAAVLVVVLAVAWISFSFEPASQGERFATGHGEERNLQLSDNTLVQLDSDSAIDVNFDGRRRSITLERGQAYFRVAKDAARPFSVRVGQSLVRDIGTSFDVYRHQAGTTITVAEGRVQVWNAPHADSFAARWLPWAGQSDALSGPPIATLDAGEQARLGVAGQLQSQGAVDVKQALAWTQGNIAFDNRPVAEVAAEFNRYNNTHIKIDDARIGALQISGTFNAHDVATFAAFLASMPGVRVEERGQQILVVANRATRPHRE